MAGNIKSKTLKATLEVTPELEKGAMQKLEKGLSDSATKALRDIDEKLPAAFKQAAKSIGKSEDQANQIIKGLNADIGNGRNKYFTSEEQLLNNLADAWQKYNSARSEAQKNDAAKSLTRFANAYTGFGMGNLTTSNRNLVAALGGSGDIESIASLVQNTNKNGHIARNYTEEAFKASLDRMREAATQFGMDVTKLFDSLDFAKIFDPKGKAFGSGSSIPGQIKEAAEATAEMQRNLQLKPDTALLEKTGASAKEAQARIDELVKTLDELYSKRDSNGNISKDILSQFGLNETQVKEMMYELNYLTGWKTKDRYKNTSGDKRNIFEAINGEYTKDDNETARRHMYSQMLGANKNKTGKTKYGQYLGEQYQIQQQAAKELRDSKQIDINKDAADAIPESMKDIEEAVKVRIQDLQKKLDDIVAKAQKKNGDLESYFEKNPMDEQRAASWYSEMVKLGGSANRYVTRGGETPFESLYRDVDVTSDAYIKKLKEDFQKEKAAREDEQARIRKEWQGETIKRKGNVRLLDEKTADKYRKQYAEEIREGMEEVTVNEGDDLREIRKAEIERQLTAMVDASRRATKTNNYGKGMADFSLGGAVDAFGGKQAVQDMYWEWLFLNGNTDEARDRFKINNQYPFEQLLNYGASQESRRRMVRATHGLKVDPFGSSNNDFVVDPNAAPFVEQYKKDLEKRYFGGGEEETAPGTEAVKEHTAAVEADTEAVRKNNEEKGKSSSSADQTKQETETVEEHTEAVETDTQAEQKNANAELIAQKTQAAKEKRKNYLKQDLSLHAEMNDIEDFRDYPSLKDSYFEYLSLGGKESDFRYGSRKSPTFGTVFGSDKEGKEKWEAKVNSDEYADSLDPEIQKLREHKEALEEDTAAQEQNNETKAETTQDTSIQNDTERIRELEELREQIREYIEEAKQRAAENEYDGSFDDREEEDGRHTWRYEDLDLRVDDYNGENEAARLYHRFRQLGGEDDQLTRDEDLIEQMHAQWGEYVQGANEAEESTRRVAEAQKEVGEAQAQANTENMGNTAEGAEKASKSFEELSQQVANYYDQLDTLKEKSQTLMEGDASKEQLEAQIQAEEELLSKVKQVKEDLAASPDQEQIINDNTLSDADAIIEDLNEDILELKATISELPQTGMEGVAEGAEAATAAVTGTGEAAAEAATQVENLNAAEANAPGASGAEAAAEDYREEGQAASEAATAVEGLNNTESVSDGAPGADAATQDFNEEAAAAEAAAEAVREAQAASADAASTGAINPATGSESGPAAGAEAKTMQGLQSATEAVTKAVNAKTQAFGMEATVVQESVAIEEAALIRLQKSIDDVIQKIQAKNDAFTNSPQSTAQSVNSDVQKLTELKNILEQISKTFSSIGGLPKGIGTTLKNLGNIQIPDNAAKKITLLTEALTKLSASLSSIDKSSIASVNELLKAAAQVGDVATALKAATTDSTGKQNIDVTGKFDKTLEKYKYAVTEYKAIIQEAQEAGYQLENGVLAEDKPIEPAFKKRFDQVKAYMDKYEQSLNDIINQTQMLDSKATLSYSVDDAQQRIADAKQWGEENQLAIQKVKELSAAEKERAKIERELTTSAVSNGNSRQIEHYNELTKKLDEVKDKIKTVKQELQDAMTAGLTGTDKDNAQTLAQDLIDRTIGNAGVADKDAIVRAVQKYKEQTQKELNEVVSKYGLNPNDNRVRSLTSQISKISDLSSKDAVSQNIANLGKTFTDKSDSLGKYEAAVKKMYDIQLKLTQAQKPGDIANYKSELNKQVAVVHSLADEYKNLAGNTKEAQNELKRAESTYKAQYKNKASDVANDYQKKATAQLDQIVSKYNLQGTEKSVQNLRNKIAGITSGESFNDITKQLENYAFNREQVKKNNEKREAGFKFADEYEKAVQKQTLLSKKLASMDGTESNFEKTKAAAKEAAEAVKELEKQLTSYAGLSSKLDAKLNMAKDRGEKAGNLDYAQEVKSKYAAKANELAAEEVKLNAINKDAHPYNWDAQNQKVQGLKAEIASLRTEYVGLATDANKAGAELDAVMTKTTAAHDPANAKAVAAIQERLNAELNKKITSKYTGLDTTNTPALASIETAIKGVTGGSDVGAVQAQIDALAQSLLKASEARKTLMSSMSAKDFEELGTLRGKKAAGATMTEEETARLKELMEMWKQYGTVVNTATGQAQTMVGATVAELKKQEEVVRNAKSMAQAFRKEYDSQKGIAKNPVVQKYADQLSIIEQRWAGDSNMATVIDNARAKFQALNEELGRTGNVTEYESKMTSLISSLNNIKAFVPEDQRTLGGISNSLKATLQTKAGMASLQDYRIQMDPSGAMYATATYEDQDRVLHSLKASYDAANGSISMFETGQQKAGSVVQSFMSGFKERAKNLAQYVGTFVSFYKVIDVLKQGVSIVTQFDTALTEMRKVSDYSVGTLTDFQKESFGLADSVGTTALQIQQSTADFMRLGQTLDEAKESAKNAALLMNVSEFDSIDDATTSLIAMSQAFSEVSQTEIIDVMNKIGNDFSVSTSGLSEALQRSASALKVSGNDLAESVALITAGNQVVQNTDMTGAGMRTIALRLTGTKQAKQELEDMGEETEGVFTTVSKLRDTILNATRVASNGFQGFDILDENKNYKSTYEMIQGIADIWQEIGELDKKNGTNQQNLLLETMAGKNRSNILASALESPDILRQAYEEAQDAAGSAAKENEKYKQSVEGLKKAFTNSTQALAGSILDSSLIKGAISGGTSLIKVITGIGNALGAIGTLSLGFGAKSLIGALLSGSKEFKNTQALQGTITNLSAQVAQIPAQFSAQTTDVLGKSIASLLQSSGLDQKGIEKVFEGAKNLNPAFTPAIEEAARLEMGMAKIGDAATDAGGKVVNMGASIKGAFANINPVQLAASLITLGISVGTMIFNAWKKYKQKLYEDASKAADEFKETDTDVDSYIKQYDQLSDALAKGNLSEEETEQTKERILQLQNEIVSKYGEQAGQIDLVNGKLDEQKEKLRGIAEEQAKQALAKNGSELKTAHDEMNKLNKGKQLVSIGRYDKLAPEIIDIARRYGFSIEDDEYSSSTNISLGKWSHEETVKNLADLNADIMKLPGYDDNLETVQNVQFMIQELSRGEQEIIEKYKTQADSYMDMMASLSQDKVTVNEDTFSMSEFFYQYAKAADEYNNALRDPSNKEGIEKAQEKYKAFTDAWEAQDEEILSLYNRKVSDIQDILNNDAISEFTLRTAKDNRLAAAREKIKASGMSKTDFLSAAETEGAQHFEAPVRDMVHAARAAGLIEDNDNSSLERLASWLSEIGALGDSAATGIDHAASSLREFLNTTGSVNSDKSLSDLADDIQSLSTGYDETINKFLTESFTQTDLTDLLQQYPELIENEKFMQDVTDGLDPSGFIKYSDDIKNSMADLTFEKTAADVQDFKTEIASQEAELHQMVRDGAEQDVIDAQKKAIEYDKQFLKNLIAQTDFSAISSDKVKEAIYESTFKNIPDMFQRQGRASLIDLAENGHAEAIATLMLETDTATWDYTRWVSEIESKEIELKARIDTTGIQNATSQIQSVLSNNSTLKGAVTSAANREFDADAILGLINQFPLLTKNTGDWAAVIGSINMDGIVTDVEAVSQLVAGMSVENLGKLDTYFKGIAESAHVDPKIFDDLRKKIIDTADLSSFTASDLANSDLVADLPRHIRALIQELLNQGVPAEVLTKILLKGDVDIWTLERDIQEGIEQIEHRKYRAQISVLTTYNSDMSSISEAESEIAQGMMTPDKALSLASSIPEVAKAAEELGLTFTDMNADEILDDVDKLQVALANAKFDRLEKLLSDKNVGRAEKLSAIANADLSRNTKQTDFFARDHVTNDWLTQRIAKADKRADKFGFENEAVYQTAVGIQMMLDAGSLENTEEAVKQAFTDLRPQVSIQLAEGSIKDIEWQITQISQAATDQMSNGYITQEQLNTLKAAGIDYSKMLEVGAKGWKLNTDKVKEYEDALRDVQIAQSKSVEEIAKKRADQLDRQMQKLRNVSSETEALEQKAFNRGQAKQNLRGESITGATEYADVGGGETEAKTDLAARIQAGATAQDLINEGYGFKDLAAAQNYLDLSGARAELEETIQKQQQYQIATAASIDIAKQFSEASSAANDRDLAETVSGGVKGVLETKKKGWWGDKNLQQYAKFFANDSTPLYRALDEFEQSWNDTWSKYYGSDGELTDDGVQQFIKDSVGKGLQLDSKTITDDIGKYTQDWLVKDVDLDQLATEWDTSRENIISLLSAFEDTRSWQQVDWSSILGSQESISASTKTMQEYIDNLDILQKYNPDMDMGQYFQTAASGLTTLQDKGADSEEIQNCVNQLNQLAELTGQDYKINITEGGNFEVVDTKLERMHELIDIINKDSIHIDTKGKVTTDDADTKTQLNQLAEFANGEGKELMLEWGFEPAADGQFTPENLADQVIEFDWKFKEHSGETPEGGFEIETASIASIDSGVDSVVSVLGEIAGYVATLAGKDRDNTNGEGESEDSESESSEDYNFINPNDPFYGKPKLEPNKEFFETHSPVSEGEVENANINIANGEVNNVHGTPRDQSKYGSNFDIEKDKYEPEKWRAHQTQEWVDGVVQKIKDGGSATIEKALEFGPQAGDAIQGWLGKYLADKYKTPRLTDAEGLANLELPWLSEKTEGLGEWFSNSGDVVKGLGKALWEEIVYGFEGGNKPDHTDNPGVQAANNAVDAVTSATLSPEDGGTNGITDPKTQENLANMGQAVADALVNLVTGHNVNASEVTEGQDTSFVETTGETGQENGQSVENVSLNAQNVQVNNDTNTPGTLANGESLTPEQRQEYSSTPETPEGEAYESESGTETGTAVINADVAELNANLPNETDPNYTPPVEESSYQFMNPSNPFEYGQPQPLQYQESWQPPAPTQTGSATPSEMSTGDMSVNAGSVTISGPVEIPKTSTDTPQPSYTPAPTSTPSPTADTSIDEMSTKVTVEADVTPAEEAIAGLGETPVTVGVDIEAPQTEEFQTVLDRVGNLGQQPVEIQLSAQDLATDVLQGVEDKSNEVDALNPTVTAQTQDNASSVLNSVISTSQEVDAQTPNVGVEATDNASSTLGKVKGLADDVESTDPNVSVSASTGNTISTLTNILNTVNQLPPSRMINITTKYTTIGNPPGQASGTFHPAHALGTVKSAFADGTVGEAWDKYSRENGLGAYAGGSDVTLKHDQLALTSEVGQESIVRDGHWYLLDSHPHMEQLKKGDIVFNASQTKDLLEHGRANGHGRVAYANGTAYNSAPAFVKMTEELRKEKNGNPKIVKSTNGKGHVEIVDDTSLADKLTNAVVRMGQEISQALDTPDDNTDTWSDDYAQIHLLNDQSQAIQANTEATQNNTKVKNQEATYVDFAEKVMNRLSKATARLQNRITEFTTYTFKKNTLRSELDSLADEIAAASAALPVYAEYLEMLRNTPIQHESGSDGGGGGGGGSDSGSDSGADDTAETNEEEAATRLETAKSNLKAAKQNLKDNYKLSDEQKKKLKNNKKIDDSEIKGSNKKNAAQVYNDALKQYKQLKKQEDNATETTAKETSKAAKNTEKYTAETAQTSSQTSSNTGAIVSSADAVRASGYDIASYTELGAAAGSDTVTILQTISGQIAGLSTQIADISVNVNIDGGSASVSSGGGGSKSSGSSDDDDGGSGGSKNGKDVDDYSWSKKNQEAIENGEKIDISTIDPSKKNKIAAAKAYNKSLKNGGGSSSSSGSSNKSSGSSNKSSSGNVKSKSGDGGVSVSSGSGKGHTASAEEKQFKKEMKSAAKDVKNSYTLTSDQQKAIKKGETLSTKGITDQTKKDAFKTYNQAVKKYNNARLSTSVSSNAPISPNNDPLHNENMRALGLIEAAQAKAGKGGGGGGGGGGSIGGIDPSSVPAGSSDKAAESIYDTLNGDYLGEFANILEDNDLIAILGLDKDLASALEEYDEFLGKLEDTKDSLEQLYQQVVSVWDELAQAPLEEADRQIEQLELGIDGLTAALGRLDSAMAGGSTLNVLDTIRETEKAAADYTATSQAVLDAIRDVNADKTDNAARQVEIRRWAVDEAKQVLEDAQKAMDEVTRDADEKIAEYKKTREETEKKLAEAQATATSTAAAVSSLEQNEYVKRYKEIEAKKALAPTGGIFSKLLGIKETEPRQNGFLSDDMPSSPYASILTGLGARQNSNDPLKRIFGFNSGADSVIEQYTDAVKKAGEATAEVTAQQSALRESTLLLAQAELDKTLREEMQAEILQQAKLAYDQAQTALAQAESEYAAQYIQEVVDNFGAVEEAFESVMSYQKALDENEELYVKNAEERGNRITAAMRQFQSGNLLGQTATLRAEIAALNEELSGDRLVYGSKEWNDLMSQILDKETELNDLLNQQHGILLSILSDVKEHYSALIDHLEQVNRLNDAWIDTAKAIGDYETELSYIQRYAEQQEMVALYLQQSADAQEQFNNLVSRGELIAGTDEYIAKQTEVLSLINDAKNAQNDLREIEADRIKYTIERYEELLERVDNYVDIIKALGNLISEAAKFDYDTGNLTDMGQASIAIEMTAWQENTEQLRDVLEERQRLRDEFASNPNFGEKEFAEALDANDKQIQEYLSNIKGAADQIVEIGITIAEKQLAAINKTIDARKEALQQEQNYYNYDKQLKSSTKDIELLNAQISALEGVSDAESKALKARLEAQRADLQEDLDNTVREHVVNLQTEGLTEMQEQLADNLDEWRNELQGDIQKQLDYINSLNLSASNIEAALNKLVLGASNGVATLSDVETAVKENGLLTSTVADVNKQYEDSHAQAVATKQAQEAGAELAARIQGAINTLGTSVSTTNIDKFTKEWAAIADKTNYNIGSTDQTGKDIQALIDQLKSDVSNNQSMKNWVDAIAAVKSPTYNYTQAQIDAMAKSGNVAKQGYSSVITNAKAVWDKMSAEQKKAYNEVAGAFHAGKTVDQMLATYTNAVDSLNKAVATNVEKAKAEMARKAAEEAKRKAEEEAKRRAAEEAARKKAEEEARKKAEEAAKKKAEEEAKKKAEEEAKQKDPRYRLMGIYNGGGGSYDGPGYSEMLYGVQSTAAATSTKASSEKVYVLTPKADDYILKQGEVLVDQKKHKKKATGTRHAQKGMTLTQEKGGEIITTKDGVLVPLKAGDGVIPANLTDKLFRMAMDYPNIGQTVALPEMKPAETNVTVSYGSLLTVNGNVDKDALPGLQDILKQAYQYTSKQLAIDAKKAGMRQARY